MKSIRIISRLDIKAPKLIKSINLEGVRVVGDPTEYATKYYAQGIDEIIYMDAVATLYGRNNLDTLVTQTADQVFVPMTVGGGLRCLANVDNMLRCGADKIAINTQAIKSPRIISEIAHRFGSQCVVLSVEAKRTAQGWEAYTDNGRNKTGKCVVSWVKQAVDLGAGELLVTSIDQEGTCAGFDLNLLRRVTQAVSVPVIASGGLGCKEHALAAVTEGGADALAIAHAFHYKKITIASLKAYLRQSGFFVRGGVYEHSACC